MNVFSTEPAGTKLDKLFNHFAREAPAYAVQRIDRVLEVVIRLAEVPPCRRKVPETSS